MHAKNVQQPPPSLGEDAACEDKSELIFQIEYAMMSNSNMSTGGQICKMHHFHDVHTKLCTTAELRQSDKIIRPIERRV